MGTRGPLPTPLRDYVLVRYRRGEFATLEEGAMVAGVSRRRVMAWLAAEGIDWKLARARWVAKHRSRALDECEGKTVRRPSKRDLRLRAAAAKAQWDKRRSSLSRAPHL
jgi:hypothetical protein